MRRNRFASISDYYSPPLRAASESLSGEPVTFSVSSFVDFDVSRTTYCLNCYGAGGVKRIPDGREIEGTFAIGPPRRSVNNSSPIIGVLPVRTKTNPAFAA